MTPFSSWIKTALLLGVTLGLLSACLATQPAKQQAVKPGYTAISAAGFKVAQKLSALPPHTFKNFLVETPTLEFATRWLKDHKFDMTERDETQLTARYTKLLKKTLEKQLSQSTGLQAVTTANSETLIVRPSLTDFRVTAPDLAHSGRTKNYVHAVGTTRLNIELKSADNVVMVMLEDYEETRSYNGPTELKRTNRAENYHDFKRLFLRWGSQLSDYIQTEDVINVPIQK